MEGHFNLGIGASLSFFGICRRFKIIGRIGIAGNVG
jgi:hypothetical protein